MRLKERYDSQDEIPEGSISDLFAEQDGGFQFVGIPGMMGSGGQQRLRDEARQYRLASADAKKEAERWAALGSFEDVQATLDRVPELEAAAGGSGDAEEKIRQQVEAKLQVERAKHERESRKLQEQLDKHNRTVQQYEDQARETFIRDAVLRECQQTKQGRVDPEAMEDAVMYARLHLQAQEERDENGALRLTGVSVKDGVSGFNPGDDVTTWLNGMREKKTHWNLPSEGGGGFGSKRSGNMPKNPWSKDHWNETHQIQFEREHGEEKAAAAARQAGSELGAFHPPGGK